MLAQASIVPVLPRGSVEMLGAQYSLGLTVRGCFVLLLLPTPSCHNVTINTSLLLSNHSYTSSKVCRGKKARHTGKSDVTQLSALLVGDPQP